ncbi:unnamed protein product, partial [marine sediment metagenome]
TLSALPASLSGGINLNWISPGDDDLTGKIEDGKFGIKYSTDSAFNFQLSTFNLELSTSCQPLTAYSYIVTGLTEGATYYIRIWTSDENPDNWSMISNGATSYAKAVAPAAVTDLEADIDNLTEGKIRLSWTSPGDDDTDGNLDGIFRIKYSTDSAFNFQLSTFNLELSTSCQPLTAHSYVVTGLDGGTTYYLRIWTADEAFNWSSISNGTTSWAQVDNLPPKPVTSITPVEVGFRYVRLNWILPLGDDSLTPYNTGQYSG